MTNHYNSSGHQHKKRRLLAFGLLLVFILAAAGAILYLQSSPAPASETLALPEAGEKIKDGMVIQLSEPCARFQKVLSDTPLVFEYGYWGFLPEYATENQERLIVEFYLDGELIGRQAKDFDIIPTSSLPCVDLAAYSDTFVENGEWAYGAFEYPGLARGEYLVDIVVSLDAPTATGLVDQGGELLYFGPGEVLRIQKELLVE